MTAPIQSSRRSGIVVPHRPAWHQRLAAALISLVIRSLAATVRGSVEDRSGGLYANRRPIIFCTWHNRLALGLVVYQKYVQPTQPGRKLAALVSASRDGALFACILEHFGVQPVRGSSSRRGAQALLELTGWAERGYDLAVTPDGPRGPRYSVQDGVIALGKITGLPIVPVSYHLSSKIAMRSWDRFQVPLPFSRWRVCFGRPISVSPEMSDADAESVRQQLRAEMEAITVD